MRNVYLDFLQAHSSFYIRADKKSDYHNRLTKQKYYDAYVHRLIAGKVQHRLFKVRDISLNDANGC